MLELFKTGNKKNPHVQLQLPRKFGKAKCNKPELKTGKDTQLSPLLNTLPPSINPRPVLFLLQHFFTVGFQKTSS